MHRATVGIGVLVFVGLAYAQAAAQDIPEEARKEIARNLHGPFMVFRDAVQEELNLTDGQKEKVEEHLRERLPDIVQFFQSLEGLNGEEREKKLQAFRQKAQEKLTSVLKATLKEDQSKRLHQLELQQGGALALFHGGPEIAKDLKITDEQRKQFMAVVQELQRKVGPLIKEAQSGGDPEEIRPKVMKIRKEHEGKIEALLTDAQKKQWKEMLGKPLALDE
jgi:Spy/CpxP family protein refolding chaperone